MNEEKILYALNVASQYIDITDGYEYIEIDGEMKDRYEIIDIIQNAINELNKTN